MIKHMFFTSGQFLLRKYLLKVFLSGKWLYKNASGENLFSYTRLGSVLSI